MVIASTVVGEWAGAEALPAGATVPVTSAAGTGADGADAAVAGTAIEVAVSGDAAHADKAATKAAIKAVLTPVIAPPVTREKGLSILERIGKFYSEMGADVLG